MNHPTVLVLGANGRFGRAAVQAFAGAGWKVLAQMRRAPASPLPALAQALVVPLEDTAAVAERAAGAGTVVYAVNPAYTNWAREMLPLARQGMAVAQRLGATFMLPGNVYNFGASMPPVLDEDTPERPTTRKGRIRCTLESEMAARAAQGLRSVVIRAGDFFGGGDGRPAAPSVSAPRAGAHETGAARGPGTWLDLAVVRSLHKGKLVYPGPLDVPHAWAYLPDLANAFVAVAALDDLPPFTRLHFTGHTVTGRELLDGVERAAAELGAVPARGLHRGGMPWGVMRILGLFVPMVREVVEMAYLWRVPHALEGTALSARVGALPATPLDAALRAALVDLGWGRRTPAAAANAGIVHVDGTRRHPA